MHIDIRYDYKPKSKNERNKKADKHKEYWLTDKREEAKEEV